MAFKGPSATLETTAERTSEQKIATTEKKLPAAVSVSVRCAGDRRNAHVNAANACLSSSSPMLTS